MNPFIIIILYTFYYNSSTRCWALRANSRFAAKHEKHIDMA